MDNSNSTNGTTTLAKTEQIPLETPPVPAATSPDKVMKEGTLLARWNDQATNLVTCLDVKTPRGRAWISQMMEQADKTGVEMAGEEFELVAFMAHDVEVIDQQTGEVKKLTRVAMRTGDGKILSTCSPSFIKSFAISANGMGPGPWNPPLRIRVRATASKKIGKYLTCCELFDDDQEQEEQPKPSPKKR